MNRMILRHKDGSEQIVDVIYEGFTEEGGFNGEPITKYDSPMAVVRVIGVDISKKWSHKTVPTKFLFPLK